MSSAAVERPAKTGAPVEPANHRRSIHAWVAWQAERTPSAIAIRQGDRMLTYAELEGRASALAARIGSARGTGAHVGIFLRRTPSLVVALLAVLKAGSTYVPLDPAYPRKRTGRMIQTADCRLILTDEASLAAIPETTAQIIRLEAGEDASPALEPAVFSSPESHPLDLAYILFTSGSTGEPNPVAITHGNVCNLLAWAHAYFGDELREGVLASTSICFDLSAFEIFAPLTVGGCIDLAAGSILDLAGADNVCAPRLVNTVPSALARLHELGAIPASVSVVNLAGEAVPEQLRDAIVAAGYRLFNLYGPSETTTYSTAAELSAAAKISIGSAIAETQVHVLDADLRAVSPGAIGELYIGGAGLARGYWKKPALTAGKFVPDPFGTNGGRLYRTGDLVRQGAGGELYFCGRIDSQIKIRGFRVELGEIEALLESAPGITRAIAVAVETESAATPNHIVAFFGQRGEGDARARLLALLGENLPGHMIPTRLIRIDEFPLTVNGKVDRKQLRAWAGGAEAPASFQDAGTESESEKALREIFSAVLRRSDVPPDESFPTMGGDSLQAVQVLARVRDRFKRPDLSLGNFLKNPTIRSFAKFVDQVPTGQAREPRSGGDFFRQTLSPVQRRLWFLHQRHGPSAAYNVYASYRAAQRVSGVAFEQSVRHLLRTRPILRTRFFLSGEGTPVQAPASLGAQDPMGVADLSGLEPADVDAWTHRLAREHGRHVHDLETGRLFQHHLVTRARDSVLMVNVHHLVADDWSVRLMIGEIANFYRNAIAGRPGRQGETAASKDGDFPGDRHENVGAKETALKDFWRKELAGVPPELNLANARPRAREADDRGERLWLELDPQLASQLREYCRIEGITLFSACLGAFYTTLYRHSGQGDLVVGTPVLGRFSRQELTMLGFFVNSLPLRGQVSPEMTLRQLSRDCGEAIRRALDHQELPFDQIVDAVRPTRDAHVAPVFQHVIGLWNEADSPLALGNTALERLKVHNGTAKHDLELQLISSARRVTGFLEYRTSVFPSEAAFAILSSYLSAIKLLVNQPSLTVSGAIRIMNQDAASLPRRRALAGSGTDRGRPDRDRPSCHVAPEAGHTRLREWLQAHADRLRADYRENGMLLFRGFAVDDAEDFRSVAGTFGNSLLPYRERSTPRSVVADKVFTSTEYPSDQQIPLHSENSYAANYPDTVWFWCVQPAAAGGQTPLADNREILRGLSVETRGKFEELGVRYVRNYGFGLDLTWQDAFQTTDPGEVDRYCEEAGIACRWSPDQRRLTTWQSRPGTLTIPGTDEKVWFNQSHLFHVSALDPATREALSGVLEEKDFPRQSYFGDGSPLGEEVLEEVRRVIALHTIRFDWQKGDVLMLDNLRYSHGRDAFSGERRVLVAMTAA